MAPKRKATGLAGFAQMLSQPEVLPPTVASAATSSPPDAQPEPQQPPAKRRKKTGLLGEGYEEYDATDLAPYYQKGSEVPQHLKKYFAQRQRFFSLYSQGCLLDDEGWFSVTPERIADQIAERCRCDTILDAFCGVGGNAIAFAKTCERVIALDVSPTRLALARHNAVIYGVQDRIEFILCDYLSFARSYSKLPPHRRTVEVVFLSPPWGGPEYLSSPTKGKLPATHPEYSLKSILPVPGNELFHLTRAISKNVAYYLPRNQNLEEVAALAPNETVEVEEEWMGEKLKALTCYFGGLAVGQSDMF